MSQFSLLTLHPIHLLSANPPDVSSNLWFPFLFLQQQKSEKMHLLFFLNFQFHPKTLRLFFFLLSDFVRKNVTFFLSHIFYSDTTLPHWTHCLLHSTSLMQHKREYTGPISIIQYDWHLHYGSNPTSSIPSCPTYTYLHHNLRWPVVCSCMYLLRAELGVFATTRHMAQS